MVHVRFKFPSGLALAEFSCLLKKDRYVIDNRQNHLLGEFTQGEIQLAVNCFHASIVGK